jgi:thiamine biosynthesis lipoprotein
MILILIDLSLQKPKKLKKTPLILLGTVLILAFFWKVYKESNDLKSTHITGMTMGTIVYNVKFHGSDEINKDEIDHLLEDLNKSLSTYIQDSEISKLNREGSLLYSSPFFYPILKKSQEIFIKTGKTFDPSIGPLVQAWGFGPNKKIPELGESIIDSLKLLVGFSKISFDETSVSIPKGFQLDFSAIAKGYGVDLISELLEESGVQNYMVEIGGEVRCKGVNEKNQTWRLGIENPVVEPNERRIFAVTHLKDRSLATSGNYRNYYEKEGRIYAHIIDPRTGYNANHRLLSASIFANDCITADAYATACMVLGLEDAFAVIQKMDELDGILIYQDESGNLKSLVSDGISPFVEFK